MINLESVNDDNRDDHVDDEIFQYLDINDPKSFFLFAGAGSGKTRSLVNVLRRMKENFEVSFRMRGQRIAVITYTNAACNEIMERLGYDHLFAVSTIHSFVWELIKPYQHDIRKWLKYHLEMEVNELMEQQAKGRIGTKASIDRLKNIENKYKRLADIENIKRFTYNPNSDNRERDSLSHNEVINMGAYFINEKKLMQKILIRKFPILLIDESQDTNKDLMESFLNLQEKQSKQFSLGLFGDTMQRIYSDGKVDLGKNLPEDWYKPEKVMNHRCCKRIVRLINNIRLSIDDHFQEPRSDKEEGVVHLFICSQQQNKEATEQLIAEKMAYITNNTSWTSYDYKELILEHHMAAKRLGFFGIYEPLYKIDKYKTSLMDGSLSGMKFFTQLILPIINSYEQDDRFGVASIVRKYSPFMNIEPNEIDKLSNIKNAKKAVDELLLLWESGKDPTCLEVLQYVAESKLFDIPSTLYAIAHRKKEEQKIADFEKYEALEDISKDEMNINAWDIALNAPFSQIKAYDSYVNGKSTFATHQGVKGLEFPHVMLIIDDSEARGFMFSYDKLFGAIEKTETDKKNEREGKDNSIDRTRRLFYVACSRAEKSLAIIAYTSDPEAVKKHVLKENWFDEAEVEII